MRRKLVNIIMEFMEEHYGLHPGQAEKIAIAKATVNYFTCFKTSGEHYYVSMTIKKVELFLIVRFLVSANVL